MARPTTLTPELIEKAQEYVENYQDLGQVVPTVAGLALHIGASRSVVYKWGEEDTTPQAFMDILDDIKAKQELDLVSGGLSNQFNSTIAKMMLTKHGYSDKQEIDHTSGGEKLQAPIYTVVDE